MPKVHRIKSEPERLLALVLHNELLREDLGRHGAVGLVPGPDELCAGLVLVDQQAVEGAVHLSERDLHEGCLCLEAEACEVTFVGAEAVADTVALEAAVDAEDAVRFEVVLSL